MARTENSEHEAPSYELLLLENQLCFALYAASRAVTRTYRDKLGAVGLTYPQFLVLMVLWEQDGATVSEIGRRLMLDSGTLTPLLKRLETMKLVQRARGDRDEREVVIRLTPEGLALKDPGLEARRHLACRLDMTEPQILALRAEIMQLIHQLQACGDAREATGAGG